MAPRNLLTLSRLSFRENLCLSDRTAVREIISSTGKFRPDEVEVAMELVEDRLTRGEKSDYLFLFAENGDSVAGYACYGHIPCSQTSFDLYWIAVHSSFCRLGIGSALLQRVEKHVLELGGERLYIETSGSSRYQETQAFYSAHGYCVEAVLRNFYARGEDKLIYAKQLIGNSTGDSKQ